MCTLTCQSKKVGKNRVCGNAARRGQNVTRRPLRATGEVFYNLGKGEGAGPKDAQRPGRAFLGKNTACGRIWERGRI